jgi:O-antigen/teichoic acid export membrane protein
MIQPISKMLIGTILLLIGIHYNVVFVAMTLGAVISMVYARKCINQELASTAPSNNTTIKNIYQYFMFTLISMICLTVFNNVDILLVRNYFTNEMVGQYSSAALFGKIILYIPQALTIMMVPIVAEHNGNEKKTLFKTMLYSLGLAGIACTGLFICKKLIITILMGEKYLPSLEYILPVCVMMLPLVGVTVLINYLIAYGDKWFVTISSAIGVIGILTAAYFASATIATMIYAIAIVYFVLFIVLLIRSLTLKSVQK